MTSSRQTPGAHARAEILSQPKCWAQCLEVLTTDPAVEQACRQFGSQSDWLFIGCGSSYYVALAAAASWTSLTGWRARAVPASELLLYPRLILSGLPRPTPVLISRSGRTSEVLKAAEYLESQENIRTLAITCTAREQLEELATLTLRLLPADEQSTVMTRSFTSMLIGLQHVAATVGKQSAFLESLGKMPAEAQKVLSGLDARVEQFVRSRDFADYVFLGQGPFYGIACEAALKVTEMSCSYGQCFNTLEFRHGPKVIVGPETLVGFLLSETGFQPEREVLEEIKGLGGTTLVVANAADDGARRAADFLVELGLSGPEYARLAAYLLAGQLLGVCTGVKKGLDPDQPRHLSRVVVLNEKA